MEHPAAMFYLEHGSRVFQKNLHFRFGQWHTKSCDSNLTLSSAIPAFLYPTICCYHIKTVKIGRRKKKNVHECCIVTENKEENLYLVDHPKQLWTQCLSTQIHDCPSSTWVIPTHTINLARLATNIQYYLQCFSYENIG